MKESFLRDGYGIVAFIPTKFFEDLNEHDGKEDRALISSVKEVLEDITSNKENCGVCVPAFVKVQLYKLQPTIIKTPVKFLKEDNFIGSIIKDNLKEFTKKRYMILPDACRIEIL